MEARVAVPEHIAQRTGAAIERLDRRLDTVVAERRAEFRRLPGVMIGGFATMLGAMAGLPGVVAHGFHWL
jgi:predicted esterase YcpF (UPF0227 family)